MVVESRPVTAGTMSVRSLPPDLQEIARKELNEDPKRTQKDINTIKEWLKKQPHLNVKENDQLILSFLRGCKFSLEKTKEKLDAYYSMRTIVPEFFQDRDPQSYKLQEFIKLGMYVPLGNDDNGHNVILVRFQKFDTSKLKMSDLLKYIYLSTDIMLWDNDRHIVAGDVIIVDFKGITLEVGGMLTPTVLKKTTTCQQQGYPQRPKASYYINVPSSIDAVLSIFKSFLKKKLQERLHIYGSEYSDVYKALPLSILPNEYGGTAGPVKELAGKWADKIMSYRERVLQEENYRSDEKKRQGKSKMSSDLFGLDGSFRNLSVD